MEQAYVHLLHLLAEHSGWTLAFVFFAAFLESIAVIGTFIPGSTAMFLAGALVGTGSLNLEWVFVCAIAGAVAGDGVSFWLGRRYRATIIRIWPFRTHPQVLDVGHRFFAKHGAKSVVFARFIGPVRAIVPVVAGMLGLTPTRFYAINVLSALLWAPVHILPGVAFGASVQLAGAVSFRLVIVIVLLLGIIWLTVRLTLFALSHAKAWARSASRRLTTWAGHRQGRAGRLALQVINSRRPAVGIIAAASVLVLLSGWLFFGVLQDVTSNDPLVRVDASVYHFLQSIRTPWGDTVLFSVGTLGSVATLAVLVATLALWMIWERRWRTLGYWLSAVAFSQLLIFAIQFAIHRPAPGPLPADASAFPSNDVAAAVVVYGFLAFFLVRRLGTLGGVLVATTSAVIVVVVAFAGLYFGRYWFSDALAGAALASVWVSIVALTAAWHRPRMQPARGFMPASILLVLCGSVIAQLDVDPPAAELASLQSRAPKLVTKSQWTESLAARLPCYRSDMDGDRKEPFTLQWSAPPGDLGQRLRAQGWVQDAGLSVRSLLALASPKVSAMALPVLPRLNNGVPSSLIFTRAGKTRDERDVLRFWPSGYAMQNPSGPAAPIWVGSLIHERLYRRSWPINILRVDDRETSVSAAHGDWLSGSATLVATRVECHAVPTTLLASPPE